MNSYERIINGIVDLNVGFNTNKDRCKSKQGIDDITHKDGDMIWDAIDDFWNLQERLLFDCDFTTTKLRSKHTVFGKGRVKGFSDPF